MDGAERNRRAGLRRTPRGRFKVELRKGTLGLGPNLAEALEDLSESGARLVLKALVAKGDEVELTLTGQGHLRPIKVVADVVRFEPLDGQRCRVGLRFQRLLKYADFQQLT
jgi:hypothetical protein